METLNTDAVLSALTLDVLERNSILNIVARFWSPERITACVACYRSMRQLDNVVDDAREQHGGVVPPAQRAALLAGVDGWLTALDRRRPLDNEQATLLSQMEEYHIPIWPWQSLAEAMRYDVEHNGFTQYADFLAYAEGAAVAPGAIFMHLCGVRRDDSRYLPPSYDIRQTARPLALFSYLVHIIRDFQRDLGKGMSYFAADLMGRSGLTTDQLVEAAKTGVATPAVRDLMRQYYTRAGEYRQQSRAMLDQVRLAMEPRYALSLEVLFDLYQLTYDKIDLGSGNFTASELNPSAEEMRKCITATVSRCSR